MYGLEYTQILVMGKPCKTLYNGCGWTSRNPNVDYESTMDPDMVEGKSCKTLHFG